MKVYVFVYVYRRYAPKQMFLANDKLFNAPLCCTTCKMWFGIYWNKEDIHWKGCYSQTKRHYVTDFQVTSCTNWHSTPRSQSGEPLPIFSFERVCLWLMIVLYNIISFTTCFFFKGFSCYMLKIQNLFIKSL